MTQDYVRTTRPARKRKPASRAASGRRPPPPRFPLVRVVLAAALVIGFGIFLYVLKGSSGDPQPSGKMAPVVKPIPIEDQRPAKEKFDYMTLLENKEVLTQGNWVSFQEEMMTVLRYASPAKLRAKIGEFRRDHPIDSLIDNIISPVRQRMNQDQNTVRHMASLLDGVLIEFAIASLAESRKKAGKDALLIGWECDDRTHLWLEAARLSQKGWHIDVLAEPIDSPRPELFPGQKIFVWTGKSPTPRQQEQLDHWREQGFAVSFHH